ncbi:5d98818b-d2fe-4323-88d4-d087cc568e36 [Sclerotinia trifoliorum]|uniref:Transcription factor BYE1 n=1 Tax=Sclerotinia trifoliorum TaxID=28548 RepID=A0A8H2VZQ3_9HELO|nr:5d98818b-d2fe-4323-88d4-d087cc568e36 [Sclerotinia trifoliorum]
MADVRKSSRATKGQHPKAHELDQPIETKKKGKKGGKKTAVQEEEEVEVIRCVCGVTSTTDDDEAAWIACDNCAVWQHNVCVGVSPYEEDTPDKYLCEQCAPDAHKELLDGIARGEQPWIARQEKHEEEKAEQERQDAEEAARKKGKKGKKRSSDQKSDVTPANGKIQSPPIPAKKEPQRESPAKISNQKRKARDDELQDKEAIKESSSKVRKTLSRPTPRASPPSDLPSKITELEAEQQGQATLIKKGLLQAIPHAIEERYYTLRPDDTIDAKAERLAIQIEEAVRSTHPNKSASIKQIRSIFSNLKQNQELCNGLLSQSLTPQALAVMTTDDMASNELKRETAIMKARADKQSIMITDDGPRIRRTHKGEEIIEGDSNPNEYSDIPMSAARRREMLDPNSGMGDRSRSRSPENEVEVPEIPEDYSSRDKGRTSSTPRTPLNIDTKQPALRKGSTQGSATGNFDINKVFSSVQSPHPSSNKQRGMDHYRRMSGNAPPANGPGDDPDVDKMLQDDNESPPYSPVEDNPDPEIVWRGTVSMDSVAKFSAYAKQVAGPDLSRNRMQTPWSELLHKDLKVHGRIDADKANEYLCGLRYSPPSDVVIINITPTSTSSDFLDLYSYFHDKKRYGVLTNKGLGNVRDTYLVPVPPGPGNIPDFVVNLLEHNLPEERPEPSLLVTLVVRNGWEQPSRVQSFDGSADPHSPLTAGGIAQRQMSINHSGPAMSPSPVVPQGGFHPSTPIGKPDERYQQQNAEEQRRIAQAEGEAVALRILGEYARAPTVSFLMPQAYQMRDLEWQAIRSILERDEKAQNDLKHLSEVLARTGPA